MSFSFLRAAYNPMFCAGELQTTVYAMPDRFNVRLALLYEVWRFSIALCRRS